MAIPDIDYCFVNPNLLDFEANTLRKALVKLHRLNAICHTSPDDWAQNLIEATKDLHDPDEQEKFYHYISNPAGFSENKQLWDALEKWDKANIDPVIIDEVSHDVWNDDLFHTKNKVIGNVMYIHVDNKQNPTTDEHNLGTIDETDEKIQDE